MRSVVLGCVLLHPLAAYRERSGVSLSAGDKAREGASGAPFFDKPAVSSLLRQFAERGVQACGSSITVDVTVNETVRADMSADIGKFLSLKDGFPGASIVAVGAAWGGAAQVPGGQPPVMDGQPLVRVGASSTVAWHSLEDIAELLTRPGAEGKGGVSFGFEAGMDWRGCWGDLRDASGRKVCDPELFRELAEDLRGVEVRYDSTGQSGSTIITNVRGFIIKNVKDEEEYALMREVVSAFGQDMRGGVRSDTGCYASAIAPICAVVQVPARPGDRALGDVQWLAMRKVELPGGAPANLTLDGDRVGDFDLKGPKFAGKLTDGKTFFGSAEVWKKKDTGFARLFPEGLHLRGCGSRDAALTLELDTDFLRMLSMTDYSLFGKVYTMPAAGEYRCACDGAVHPTFPLVLDAPPYRIAWGIIDYLERKVNFLEERVGISMSTMKDPVVYKEWWMRMWPSYFHLPRRGLDPETGRVPALDHQPAERLQVGQRVRALQKIKWVGGALWRAKKSYRKSIPYMGRMYKTYFRQLREERAGRTSSGSKYKVVAGDTGFIKGFERTLGNKSCPPAVVVVWNRFNSHHKAFRVEPHQIMSEPRSYDY